MENLTDSNFVEKTSGDKVLVQFSAGWCGPCKILTPLVESISFDLKFKVDVDACPETSKMFNIRSVPTLVLLKNGVEVARKVGAVNKTILEAFVNQ